MCHGNKFLNNLAKMIKIEGIGEHLLRYFIDCLLPCTISTKTNYRMMSGPSSSLLSSEKQSKLFSEEVSNSDDD